MEIGVASVEVENWAGTKALASSPSNTPSHPPTPPPPHPPKKKNCDDFDTLYGPLVEEQQNLFAELPALTAA